MLVRSTRSFLLLGAVTGIALALAGCPGEPMPIDAPLPVVDVGPDTGRDAGGDVGMDGGVDPCDAVKLPCAVAGTTCEGDSLVVCAADADGCLVETSTDCGDTDQVCSDKIATPACVDPCSLIPEADRCDTVDARVCTGDSLEVCTADADGCLVLERTDCGAVPGGSCDDTGVMPVCLMPPDPCAGTLSRCDVEGTRCAGAALVTCAPNAFGCLVETRANCSTRAGGTCDATGTPPACVFTGDPCAGITECAAEGTSCVGPELVRCRADAYGCLVETRTDCTDAMFGFCDPDSASGAICTTGATDPCMGVTECGGGTTSSTVCTDGTTLTVCAPNALGCYIETVTDCAASDEICRASGSSAACAPGITCGDGLVEGTEACDDENTDDGDGCSATCAVEAGWVCDDSEPSVCGTTCENLAEPVVLNCASGTVSGDTASGSSAIGTYSCGGTFEYPGNEQVWAFTNEQSGRVLVTIEATRISGTGDYDLFALEDSTEACGTASCADSSTGTGAVEIVEFGADPGADFDIVYDLFNVDTQTTTYTLDITCTPLVCGDGNVALGETCDDGDAMGGDGCSATCTTEPGYICPATGGACRMRTCGDGLVDAPETCDDGDATAGDGCSDTCTVEPGYLCDGASPTTCVGPATNGTCATATPVTAAASFPVLNYASGGPPLTGTGCGFGSGNAMLFYSVTLPASTLVQVTTTGSLDRVLVTQNACGDAGCASATDSFPEQATLSNTTASPVTRIVAVRPYSTFSSGSLGISFAYTALVCGDGIRAGSEACDDGDTMSGDGCSDTCTVEAGFSCTTAAPSVCTANCGNGAFNAGETCDDGNTMSGDGCSATCQLEGIDVTVAGTGTPLAIPDPGTAMSTAIVSSACTIGEAIVSLQMNHAYAGDVVLTLRAPDGTNVVLTNSVGDGRDMIGTYIFRSTGATWLPATGDPIPSGTYAAAGLGGLVGDAGMGTWTLIAEDDDAIIAGSVTAWSLLLTCD